MGKFLKDRIWGSLLMHHYNTFLGIGGEGVWKGREGRGIIRKYSAQDLPCNG
jgi:hypothetical protein